jgi:hypothetical protein
MPTIINPKLAQKLAKLAEHYPTPAPVEPPVVKKKLIKKPSKLVTALKEAVEIAKNPPLNPETMSGTELVSIIEKSLPKMTILTDGKKGPTFEEKEIKELAKTVPEAHAKVYVEYSRKLSDGNYGSVGFTVGLQMPVGTAYHEIEEGFETACQFVDDKLSGLLNAATKKE